MARVIIRAGRHKVLVLSFGITFFAFSGALALLLLTGASVNAGTCTWVAPTSGTVSWTQASWSCAPAETYPGQLSTDTVTLTNSTGPLLWQVNTSTIPNPVQVNLNCTGGGCAIEVLGGGKLALTGASSAGVPGLNSNVFTIDALGTLSNAGTISIVPGAAINLNGGTVDNSGTITMATATSGAPGTFNWSGGTVQNTGSLVTNHTAGQTDGTINVTGTQGAMTLNAQTITDNGTLNFSSSNGLTLSGGAQIAIGTAGQMNLSADGAINGSAAEVIGIASGGTLKKTGGTNSTVSPKVNNGGTVNVSTGSPSTLNLAGGGTHTGSFGTIVTGSVLNFSGGTHDWNAGTSFPGPSNFGTIGITGGIVNSNVTPSLSIPNLAISGGQLNVPSGNAVAVTSLIQTGGTISGPGNISPNSSFTWNGGTQNGGGSTTLVPAAVFSPGTAMVLSGSRVLDLGGGAYTSSQLNNTKLGGDGTGVLQLEPAASFTGNSATTDIMQVVLDNYPSAASGGAITVSSGTLQLNAGGIFGNTVTINPGASLVLPAGSSSSFNAGSSVTGTGTLAVAGSLQLNQTITPANAIVSGSGIVKGPAVFQPTNLTWSGGTLGTNGDGGQVVIPPVGTVTLNPLTSVSLAHPFLNSGTLTWTGTGTLGIDYSTTFANGGTFDARDNGILTCGIGCGSSIFSNSGTFKKTTTAGGTTIVSSAITFNNAGSVDAQTGTIQLAGGTSSGTFNTTASPAITTIDFPTGTHTLTGTANFTGGGKTSFSGANIVLGSSVTPANVVMSAGSVTGSGNFSPTNLSWSGGTIGSATDTGSVTIPVGGSVVLNPGFSATLSRRTMTNNGSLTWTGSGTFYLDNNAVFNNASGAMFDAQGTGAITCSITCGSSAFNNSGTFQKTISTGATVVSSSVAFNNNGTMNGQAGTISLLGGGTSNGFFFVGGSGKISFDGGTNTLAAASTVSGSGTIAFTGGATATISGGYSPTGTTSISGATVTMNTSGATGVFSQNTGTLNGTGPFSINNGGTVAGGTVSVTGNTTLIGGTLNLTGSSSSMTWSSPLTIDSGATVNFTSPSNPLLLGSVTNNGAFVHNASANVSIAGGTPTFSNAASFTRTGGTSSAFAVPFTNSGTVQLQTATTTFTGGYAQTAGTTQLFGGNLASPSAININAGSLAGIGTIAADLNNSGAISVGTSPVNTGVLTVSGNYQQSSTGSLALKIQGPTAITQYDQFNTTGSVSLNGGLSVTGGYTPTATDTFTIMNFASKSGDFASKSFPSAAYRASYLPTSAPTSLVLAAPVFDLSATQSGPSTVVNGNNAVVTVTVANAGPSAVDATLNGTFSGPASFGAVPTATGGGTCSIVTTTSYTCTWSSIGATSNTVTLTLGTTGTGTISTNATVSSSLSPDSTPSNDTAPALSISVTPSVDLGVAISGTPDPVTSGGTVTYTVKVTNTGLDSSTASDPITLTLTGGTIASTSGAFTCAPPSGGTVSCTMPSILPSGGFITETVTATAGTGTSMSLAGTVSDANDTNSTNDSATAIIGINASADIAVTQSGPASVIQGQNATIVVTVTNNGPSAATNVTVADAPTNGGVVGAASSQGTCAGSPTWNCNLGTLASGASATATYTVNAPGPSPLTNSASANATESDPFPANNNATPLSITVVNTADIAVSQSALPTSITAGQNSVFTIVVVNNGPSAATNVNVSDSYTGGTFSSVSSTPGASCSGVLPVACSIANLASGASETITLTLTGNAAGTLTNTVNAGSPAPDSNTTNNNSVLSVSVGSGSADLTVTSSASPNPVNPGQDTTITAIVKNLGPSTATNVVLTDSFTGGTFGSASTTQGSCTPSPSLSCSIGTLASGGTATVTIVLHAGTGTGVQNTASVSANETDPNNANNSSTLTISTTARSDISVSKSGPASAVPGATVTYTISVSNAGPSTANGIAVTDPTPTGLTSLSVSGACTTLPCSISSLASGATTTITATYTVVSGPNAPSSITNSVFVSVKGDPNNANNTATVTTVLTCATQPPTLVAPLGTSVVTSPVAFSWTAVTNAVSYEVFVTQGGTTRSLGTTSATSLTGPVATGAFSWYVVATTSDCGLLTSSSVVVNACNRPDAPVASVVANAASGQTYSVQWDGVAGAGNYEIQEATNAAFTDATTQTVTGSPVSFTHSATDNAQPFFYRVRAVAACDSNQKSAYSTAIRVVIGPNATVPAGSTKVVVQEVHIPGIDDGNSYTFSATTDKPWLTVAPSNGVLPPLGINLQVSANPSPLNNGTSTGTVIVSITPAATTASNARTNGTTTVSVPVSISLVTPVTPTNPTTTPANAMVIPSVGHLDGLNSQWQSDIRLANTGFSKQQVLLTFSPTGSGSSLVTAGPQQTTISIDAGSTVALDDVAHNWFGVGSLGEAANGVLVARPLSAAGAKDSATLPSVTTVVASSRTYSVSSAGTLGQYIPAIPFSSFIGAAAQGQLPTVLSLQQIAQSDAFRTNLGLVEAAGAPAAVTISVFDDSGKDIKDIPLSINPFQQLQLNAFLASQGITLNDGRIEVKVTSGTGKVTAYASVVDNRTNDPLLVSGVPLSATLASQYVLPGVADLNNGAATWRSDVRIFNAGSAAQSATLTLFPLGGGTPLTANATLNPGEVKLLDNAVQTLFGATNVGGALHVTTPSDSSLIVTGRTYNVGSDGGTYGQFIPAVTPNDAVGNGGRTLQILQVEDSPRYRTNLGIAEVTGQPATAEITVFLPDAKVAPRIDIPLEANEYRQFPIIQLLGLGNVYNARVSVSVVGGTGKITAYGSVVDQVTQDSTYVPAQQ